MSCKRCRVQRETEMKFVAYLYLFSRPATMSVPSDHSDHACPAAPTLATAPRVWSARAIAAASIPASQLVAE